MRRSFEDRLFGHRSRFAFVVAVLVVGLVVLLLLLLLLGLAGLQPIPGLPLAATVSDVLSALLAVGTLSLAYAAGLQVLSTERKHEGDLRPHLDLQVIKEIGGPVCWSTFLVPDAASAFYIRLRNYGPGVAVGVRLMGFDWRICTEIDSAELQDLSKGGSPRQPLLSDPILIPSEVIKEPISLAVNEGFEFHYQVRVPPLQDLGAAQPQPSTSYLQQVVFVATYEDVEGRKVEETSAGFLLDALFPALSFEGKSLRSYSSVWRRLPTDVVAAIPRGRLPRQ